MPVSRRMTCAAPIGSGVEHENNSPFTPSTLHGHGACIDRAAYTVDQQGGGEG